MKLEFEIAFIAVGGALGALTRFAITEASRRLYDGVFPVGTLTANLLGCFLMGIFLGSDAFDRFPGLRAGVGIGFLGALTTFSTFGAETVKQLQSDNGLIAASNIIANVMLGIGGVIIGIWIAKKIF
ncbi:MAG: fluoride efflux transporter CrcB [Planctomycetota bacterium]